MSIEISTLGTVQKSTVARYSLAISAAFVALFVRLSFAPILGDKVPYATFFLATTVSALYGGFRPGILTTVLGALLAGIFMLPPAPNSHFTDPTDYLGLGIFVLISTILSGLSGKLAETEAREKDLRQVLQRTLLSIGDAVISTGADMRVVLMNPVAEDLTGWKEAEAQGKLISEVFRIMQEGSDIAVENPVVKVLQSGTIVGLANHTDLVRRDGKRIPIDDSASPVKTADGSISGVVLIFRDISQRRQSERNLEAARQNAESILESISDAFVALDSTWRITYVNHEAQRLNSLSRTDMLGKNHWDLFPETVGTTLHREYLRAHKDRIPLKFLTFYEPWKRWFDIRVYPAANGGLSVFYQDVTDRKLADAQLKDSEERMSLLIESAKGHAIFGLDMEGHVTNWNVGAERLFLYDRAEILGESAVVLFTPEDRETMALEEELFAAHENGVARYERWHLRRDGVRFWGSGTVTPLRDGNGVLKGFVKVFQDRTQEWHAEQSLRASERRFRAAIEASSALLWTNDATGKMDGEQPGWGGFTGQSPDEYQGFGWSKAVHPDDAQPTIAAWEKAVASGTTFEFEHRVRRHDGAWRLFSIRAVPVLDEAGAIKEWVGVHTDITDQRSLVNALQESEARFRMLANNISQFAWTADHTGSIFWYNQRWYDYTGTTLEEMQGWGWMKVHHPDHLEKVADRFRACIERGEAWQDTFPLRSKDGEWRWFLSRALPILDEGGNVVWWFGTNTDITEDRAREEDLRLANQDLEQFAFTASHDLKEPLRNLVIFSQLLQQDYSDKFDAAGMEYLQHIVDGAQRMDALISDLLAYTHTTRLDYEAVASVNAEAVLEQVLKDLSSIVQQGDASIRYDPMPAVAMKEVHLRQLFQNLIGNAIKYSKDNEPPRIYLTAEQNNDVWKFSVQDNGIGIAQEYQKQVFGLFKRLHVNGGKYPGTGIGLAICHKIVELYGGRIWVQSEVDMGTTVHFTIPVPASEASA